MDASKRVKRSFPGNDSLVPAERDDDVVEATDASSAELGMGAWRPMDSRLVKGFSGDKEVKMSQYWHNSFHLHQTELRKKAKEIERRGNHRKGFIVAEPSRSNRAMVRKDGGSLSSPKKDQEVLSFMDVGLKHRQEGGNMLCGMDLQGKVDQFLLDGVSSIGVQSTHLHCEHNYSTKKKRKVDMEDDALKDKQYAGPAIQFSRKPHDFNVNMLNDIHPIKYKEEISSYLPEQRNGIDTHDRDPLTCAFSEPISVSRRKHNWGQNVKSEKECKSLRSEFGEASGSIFNQLSYPQSHAEIPHLKLEKHSKTKRYGIPSIAADKLYPEVRCSNSHVKQSGFSDDICGRVGQIESDEVFARELQEQFYHETTGFIDREMADAKIARSLQNEEDAKVAALAWQDQSRHSDSSVANVHLPHQTSSLVVNHFHTLDHALMHRNHEYVERYPAMVMLEKFGRNLNNEVDLETRLELLEAVEDMLEANYMLEHDDLAFSHSFNDTGYETPSNLDESNHQLAGSHEINSLPLSVVQNDNNGEACSVCLDIPSVGETLRHLPCLHRFHKKCIDTWLRRKPSCPVCKSSIK